MTNKISLQVRGCTTEEYAAVALRVFANNNDGAAGRVIRVTRTNKGATVTVEATLTVHDIESGYSNDAWQGFGYLGERRNAAEAVQSGEWEYANVTAADTLALRIANDNGWTPARFFQWLNSKDGRWYADMTIGSDDFGRAAEYVR